MCDAHLFDGALICTGATGHQFGHTYVGTGGGVDAEAAGEES